MGQGRVEFAATGLDNSQTQTGPEQMIAGTDLLIALARGVRRALLLSDPAVSRAHCMLRCDGNTVTVYDVGSSTGTKLDGEAVTGRPIAASDIISLGTTEVMFVKAN